MNLLLLGTDFSARSDRALRRASLLARQGGQELLIVHVMDDNLPRKLLESHRRDAAALLHEMEQRVVEQEGVVCRTDIRLGRTAEQLAQAAIESNATVMIIGLHRPAPIRDAFGSITAERIVRYSPSPLLVAAGDPARPYHHALLPVDFGEASRSTAVAIRKIPIVCHSSITLLHVYDAEAREMLGRSLATADVKRDYLLQRAARAKQELEEFAASAGIDADLLVEESQGTIGGDIERVAASFGINLIALSRSNKGAIEKSLVGSVAESLLRSCGVDVLVFP